MTKPKAKKLTNRFVICLDSSGSMRSIHEETVNAFNSNVDTIRKGAKQAGQTSTVGLITFGEGEGDVSKKFLKEDASSLENMKLNEFRPQGMTPMLDGIGLAVESLQGLKDDKNTSYVVLIITDGEENHSKKYTAKGLQKLMEKCQATDKWTFAFLVPPGHKQTICNRFGVPPGNVQEWEANAAGMARAAASVNVGMSSYYSARASGQTCTRGFFETNMAQVKSKEVRALGNRAGEFFAWKVPAECEIRAFVEDHNCSYVKGNGYYQLTKDEEVQHYKEILIMEKGKSAVYGGADARDVLGLPDLNVKVRPGNHANYDIFIQSTSFNRKLVRGTTFLYRK